MTLGATPCRPQLLHALELEDATGDRCEDFVSKLCDLFELVDRKVHGGAARSPVGSGGAEVGGRRG